MLCPPDSLSRGYGDADTRRFRREATPFYTYIISLYSDVVKDNKYYFL